MKIATEETIDKMIAQLSAEMQSIEKAYFALVELKRTMHGLSNDQPLVPRKAGRPPGSRNKPRLVPVVDLTADLERQAQEERVKSEAKGFPPPGLHIEL